MSDWVSARLRRAAAIGDRTIGPGYALTPMNLSPGVAEQRKTIERETPLGRTAVVEEMVGPAIFLLSPAASLVTGVDLLVDSGFECG